MTKTARYRERESQLSVSHLMRGGHMVVTQHRRSLKYRTRSNQTHISATIRAVLPRNTDSRNTGTHCGVSLTECFSKSKSRNSSLAGCSSPALLQASGPAACQTRNLISQKITSLYFTSWDSSWYLISDIWHLETALDICSWIKFGRLLACSTCCIWSSSAGTELFNIWQESECHTLLTWNYIFLLTEILKIVLLLCWAALGWYIAQFNTELPTDFIFQFVIM